MSQRHFRQLLTARQEAVDSLVCVGLDPNAEKMPACVRSAEDTAADAAQQWMMDIVDTTAPFACMFKPQLAHWEAIEGGVDTLREIIDYIHDKHPDIPVLVDCKRGDIDRTQARYRQAVFDLLGGDAMNYNGYMGKSTLASLVDPKQPGRGLVGLGRTSNAEAWEIQDAPMADGRPLWQFMLERQLAWSSELGVLANAGIVMGAAHKDPADENKPYAQHLMTAREMVWSQMWFLIPGIGAQGGFVEATVKASFTGPGTIAINSSSKITEASSGKDYAEAAGRAAKELRDEIRAAGGSCR